MASIDQLTAIKKRLEGDLFAVNRAIALIKAEHPPEATNGDSGTVEMFDAGATGELGVTEAFRAAVRNMSKPTFTSKDIKKATQGLMGERRPNMSTFFGLINKSKKSGFLAVVKEKSGKSPAIYRRGN